VKKELRPVHENVACEVCGRTMLKGERTESFLAPGGRRHEVCDLCFARAEHLGWIRESASGELPTRVSRPEPRRPLLGRLLRRVSPPERAPLEGANGSWAAEESAGEGEQPLTEQPAPRSRPQEPRHVRAVPTTAEVKVERALELFNASDHRRTIAGLVRTLGPPWAAALPDIEQASEVSVVVAWELSWYRFRIDLGDEADPVVLLHKGDELEEIPEPLRTWNATVDADGRVLAGVGSEQAG
jgi:hypothetical protein